MGKRTTPKGQHRRRVVRMCAGCGEKLDERQAVLLVSSPRWGVSAIHNDGECLDWLRLEGPVWGP